MLLAVDLLHYIEFVEADTLKSAASPFGRLRLLAPLPTSARFG
ncbi:hypothetical protein [Bradyrhizobium sp. Ec3.3]|nr:hypothetical protein [Bradyrhizobium sp. Ec3.3]